MANNLLEFFVLFQPIFLFATLQFKFATIFHQQLGPPPIEHWYEPVAAVSKFYSPKLVKESASFSICLPWPLWMGETSIEQTIFGRPLVGSANNAPPSLKTYLSRLSTVHSCGQPKPGTMSYLSRSNSSQTNKQLTRISITPSLCAQPYNLP